MSVDPRLVAALRKQLERRPAAAGRVGWKYGSGDAERIGDETAVGHLTTQTLLIDGSTYRGGGGDLHADAEVAVELGNEAVVRGYAPALEIVDLARRGMPEDVVALNVFHCAVAFGRFVESLPPRLEGAIVVNGQRRDAGPAPTDVRQRVAAVARVLAAVGEALRPGDRVITGLVVQVPVRSGDEVVADFGALGRVGVTVA